MNIGLLYGGNSCEHEISILSMLQLCKYFKDEVTLIYLSKENRFYTGECLKEYEFYRDINLKKCKEISFSKQNQEVILKPKDFFSKSMIIDMIFPILHGGVGEDGSIQGFFELLDIPYAQSKLSTCNLCMDKDLTKKLFQVYELPHLSSITLNNYQVLANLKGLEEIKIPKPWIIKPSKGGSSIGINCVSNDEEMTKKIVETFAFDNKIIVEPKLENAREFNIAILGDEHEQYFSNIEEVQSNHDFYSYTDKYGGSTLKQSPASRTLNPILEENLENQIKEIALKSFKAFECSGVVRFDFLYSNQLYLNEINTIPGSYSIYLFRNILEPTQFIEILKNIAITQYKYKKQEIKSLDSFVFKNNWNQMIKK